MYLMQFLNEQTIFVEVGDTSAENIDITWKICKNCNPSKYSNKS